MDRPPYLNDCEAMRQQCLGLVGKNLADTIRTRPFRIVVVRGEHRLTDELFFSLSLVARAQGVVEDYHTRSPRRALDQLFDLRIIHRLQLRWVREVRNLGLMFDEYETLLVQRKLVGEQPAIADCDLLEFVSSGLAPANVVWAEGLVHELLAGVHSVGNIDIHSFNHRSSSLYRRRSYVKGCMVCMIALPRAVSVTS